MTFSREEVELETYKLPFINYLDFLKQSIYRLRTATHFRVMQKIREILFWLQNENVNNVQPVKSESR